MLLVESPVSASFFTSQEPNQRPRPAHASVAPSGLQASTVTRAR